MEQKIIEALISAGAGGLVAIAIIYFTYKLAREVLLKLGAQMVGAFESQASALTRQAQSMEGLSKALQEFVARDNAEHREIIILLKVISERFDNLEERWNRRRNDTGASAE